MEDHSEKPWAKRSSGSVEIMPLMLGMLWRISSNAYVQIY